MNIKFFEWGKSDQYGDTRRQSTHEPRVPTAQRSGLHGFFVAGAIACVVVLLMGLGEHYGTVVPLEKELLSREVRWVAGEIDAAVKLKSAIITTAAGIIEVDTLLENGNLEKLLRTLREHLSDFFSLEIINDRGEIVAMIGELPLSQAGTAAPARTSRFVRVSSDINYNEGVFADDPAHGCFSVTCRHIGPQKGQWFSRTRFSRESINRLLASVPQCHAGLVQLTGISKMPRINQELQSASTTGNWWTGPSKAEAFLDSPGWIVQVEKISPRSVLRPLPILLPTLLLLFGALAYLARLFITYRKPAAPAWPAVAEYPNPKEERLPNAPALPAVAKSRPEEDKKPAAATAIVPAHDAAAHGQPEQEPLEIPENKTTDQSEPFSVPEDELLGAPDAYAVFDTDFEEDNFPCYSSSYDSEQEESAYLVETFEFHELLQTMSTEDSVLNSPESNESELSSESETEEMEQLMLEDAVVEAEDFDEILFQNPVTEQTQDVEQVLLHNSVPETDDSSPESVAGQVTVESVEDIPMEEIEASATTGDLSHSFPECTELPEDNFASLVASSEASVDHFLNSLEDTMEPESDAVDSAVLAGEPDEPDSAEEFSAELDIPEDYFDDPPESVSVQRAAYYPAVILGPPLLKGKARSLEQDRAAQVETDVLPETLELSWTEPLEQPESEPVEQAFDGSSDTLDTQSQVPDSLEVTWSEPEPEAPAMEVEDEKPVLRHGSYAS
ncbi:MAG TPA: hypothetical protein VK463_19185 [Desulfomonilaceae bacterium]|nr:hypothetical protein [Desulfomonilaceae bacterium]